MFTKLADKIMAEAYKEWNETKEVNKRLIELGVTPVAIEEYPFICDIKEIEYGNYLIEMIG